MFQYRIQDKIIDTETLKIYNGFVKATKEEIEITAIKRDCYKHNLQKVALEKYLKSKRDILTIIDIFPSKVFPTKTNGEWLVIVETKQYYNLTDFILNNVEIENNIRDNMDILSLIYELITVILTFSNYDETDFELFYKRLIPQNIFISEFNEIYLKFPYWLLMNDDKMSVNELNLSFRYYLPPHLLFNISKQNHKFDTKLLCNVDIWCLGCCIAEIFYGLPLFSSIDISDQFLKMFQILGYPDWTKIPWKYWKISDKFKKSIQIQQDENSNCSDKLDCLDKMINNGAIVDLLRSCLQYSSQNQISFDQLSVFVDMFEINDKTENQKDRLTFNDIQSWHSYIPSNSTNKKQDIIIIGSSTFIDKWSLKSPKKQKQKGVQTKKVKTTDNSTNTQNTQNAQNTQNTQTIQTIQSLQNIQNIQNTQNIQNPVESVENDLNITDCINILPFSKKQTVANKCKQESNLLILEFSNICNLDTLSIKNTKSFSFQCVMDNEKSIFSSPIFNIDNLRQTNDRRQKVYIHIMLKDQQCKDILNANQCINIQIIAHDELDKSHQKIGEINIDISMLTQYKIIEGYYHILPESNDDKRKKKLGQVYVRVLPQFNIKEKNCNESVVSNDDHSMISNHSTDAWSMFNKFVHQQTDC